MNNKDVSIYADYNNWFSKDAWTLEQAAVLMIGLNPDVVLDQELHQQYEDYQAGHDIQITENMYRLERYSEKFWDWREAISDAVPRFYDFYCASELDDLVETFPYVGNYEGYKDATVIPMDIIQWCVDEGRSFHYGLTEHLEKQGYDFRFSDNSKIIQEIRIFSKMDVWPMPAAARLILGLSPEASAKHCLHHIRNYYRHIDPNYNMTKRDEVYYVLETALQSWKTGKLTFFNIYGDDAEDGYYSEEDCGVEVNAHAFVNWATQKGFQPPAQLLELMGLQEQKARKTPVKGMYVTPYMEIMYEAIDALKITNDNQPAKQTIVDWLKEKNPDLSGREIEYLATFVRTPDMKKGGFYKGKSE